MTCETLVALGTLGRPHGVRGEVRFLPFNPASTTLHPGSTVVLRRGDREETRRILALRPHQRFLLLTLDGCTSMTAAEALVGADVCVPTSALPPPGPGEIYHHRLIGLAVVTVDGTPVGTVADIMAAPSCDVCVVRAGNREHLIPMVADIVKAIDADGGRIVIDPLPGLLDT